MGYYIVLDTETTGLHPPQNSNIYLMDEVGRRQNRLRPDEILQLAIIDQNGTVLFYDNFKPTIKTSWLTAQAIHNIAPKDVATKLPFSERVDEIQNIVAKASFIVAYNAAFDFGFLQGNGINLLQKPYVCAMEVFAHTLDKRKHYGSYEWKSLAYCANYFGLENAQAHDALSDAQLTLTCFKAMADDAHFHIQPKPWKVKP